MENNTNDTYQSKIVNRDFVNHVYDLCEKSKEYDWHKIIEPKNNENGGESKEDVKKRLKRAFNNIFKYLEPDSKYYIGFNALLYNHPNSYQYELLISFAIAIYNITYYKFENFPINQKTLSAIFKKSYGPKDYANINYITEIMIINQPTIYFETKDVYNFILNRTHINIIDRISKNKSLKCFINIIEELLLKIDKSLFHIDFMKKYIMDPQNNNEENEAFSYIHCKLYHIRRFIPFYINILDIIINNYINISENSKFIDDFIKHIEDYQPCSYNVDPTYINYDFSSFINFLLLKEFYKKQKEVYNNIEQVADVDLDNFNEVFKSYITDVRKFNLDEFKDPEYLSELKNSQNKHMLYILFSDFINELNENENENYISKVKGCHNIIFYLSKFTENLANNSPLIYNNYYLETVSYIQLMLTKNYKQLKNTVKLKNSLYSTITDKLFSVIPDNKNYVYYDPTIVLINIEALYIHILKYIDPSNNLINR